METIKIARAFVPVDTNGNATKFSDAQANTIVSDRKIPLPSSASPQNYKQLFTKGETAITVTPENVEVGNDQMGTTGIYRKNTKLRVSLPLSTLSFKSLLEFARLDPTAELTATAGDYKENSGLELSGLGFSLLVYDKGSDPDNDSDIPDFTNDDNAQVFFACVVQSETKVGYNGDQGVLTLDLTPLANTSSTGAAKGKKGSFGTFTAAA